LRLSAGGVTIKKSPSGTFLDGSILLNIVNDVVVAVRKSRVVKALEQSEVVQKLIGFSETNMHQTQCKQRANYQVCKTRDGDAAQYPPPRSIFPGLSLTLSQELYTSRFRSTHFI
jgi:hypothetical protein